MNQYDFAPIPPEDRQKMRHYIIAGVFALVMFIFAICMFSCNEQNNFQPEISGGWTSVMYPANQYLFHGNGTAEIYTESLGSVIWQKWLTYEHDKTNGALEMRDKKGVYFKGSVSFNESGDTARLRQDGGINIILAKW